MTQIAYSGLFWTQFRVSRDLFTDLTAGKATVRTFLQRLLTAASRIQNCAYRKIITFQTPQSNLPSMNSLFGVEGLYHARYPFASCPPWCGRCLYFHIQSFWGVGVWLLFRLCPILFKKVINHKFHHLQSSWPGAYLKSCWLCQRFGPQVGTDKWFHYTSYTTDKT